MQFYSMTGASLALSVAPSTIKGLEARGVVQKFIRDSSGRRVLTEFDLAAIRAHLAKRQPAPPAAA